MLDLTVTLACLGFWATLVNAMDAISRSAEKNPIALERPVRPRKTAVKRSEIKLRLFKKRAKKTPVRGRKIKEKM
jgi:hypothetical protein